MAAYGKADIAAFVSEGKADMPSRRVANDPQNAHCPRNAVDIKAPTKASAEQMVVNLYFL
jgi:hypothetical protein